MLNSHYKDILSIFSEKKVKFLLLCAYAMAAHVFPRSTMDIDILVMPSCENASFESAYSNSKLIEVEGIPIRVLSIPDLIINK